MQTRFNHTQTRVLLSSGLTDFAMRVMRELDLTDKALETFTTKEVQEIVDGLALEQGSTMIKTLALTEEKQHA